MIIFGHQSWGFSSSVPTLREGEIALGFMASDSGIQFPFWHHRENTWRLQLLFGLWCRIIFPGQPKQFIIEHATPVKAVLALWKGALRLESDAWEFDDQDRLFPVDDPSGDWEEDEAGICVPVLQQDMFDFRYIHHREMVQSLLKVEEADILWHDQFDLVPLAGQCGSWHASEPAQLDSHQALIVLHADS